MGVQMQLNIMKNLAWSSLAEVAVRGLRAITIMVIVRALGPNEYGHLAYALSLAAMVGILLDLGLTTAATRELSNRGNEQLLLPAVSTLKTVLGVFSLVLTAMSLLIIPGTGATKFMLVVFVLYLFSMEGLTV